MGLISSTEMCRRAGITYRQLDWWDRQGVFCARVPPEGSGSRRMWDEDQVPMIRTVAKVVQAFYYGTSGNHGIETKLMKDIADNWQRGWVDIGDSVRITWGIENG